MTTGSNNNKTDFGESEERTIGMNVEFLKKLKIEEPKPDECIDMLEEISNSGKGKTNVKASILRIQGSNPGEFSEEMREDDSKMKAEFSSNTLYFQSMDDMTIKNNESNGSNGSLLGLDDLRGKDTASASADDKFSSAHAEGSSKRKSKKLEKKDLFEKWLKKLKDTYFVTGFNSQTILDRMAQGMIRNADGSGPCHIHIKPTWADFSDWKDFGSFMYGDKYNGDYSLTNPETCLIWWMNEMKKEGIFGKKYNIGFEIVPDTRENVTARNSRKNKLRIYWDDMASSHNISPTTSLNDVGRVVEKGGKSDPEGFLSGEGHDIK